MVQPSLTDGHMEYLTNTLKKHYNVNIDWNDEIFCGIKLKWDYYRKTAILFMPNYVNKALERLQHPPTINSQHPPHAYNAPIYGQKR